MLVALGLVPRTTANTKAKQNFHYLLPLGTSSYIAQAGLELAIELRPASNTQFFCLYFPPAGITGV
jgi:hypothetical protein